MTAIKLAPSILSADLLKLEAQIKEVEQNGADFIHVDVMDGQFVPNLTFGPVIVRALKRITNLPLDVHLMMLNADRYVAEFAQAGATFITVHQEAITHLHSTIADIQLHGVKAGVSLNPATPLATLDDILPDLDMVLIMSVNPGFGGQKFLPLANSKVNQLSRTRKERQLEFLIEVDGGVNDDTTPGLVRAGADVLVAGNAIFAAPDIGQACQTLKSIAQNEREQK